MRSYYFLWLEKHARRVLKGIAPWGLAVFSGDVVESINAILKDSFLRVTDRGGGDGTSAERDGRLLMQAMRRGCLHKKLPRWVGRAHKPRCKLKRWHTSCVSLRLWEGIRCVSMLGFFVC